MRYKQGGLQIQRSYTNNCVQHAVVHAVVRHPSTPPTPRSTQTMCPNVCRAVPAGVDRDPGMEHGGVEGVKARPTTATRRHHKTQKRAANSSTAWTRTTMQQEEEQEPEPKWKEERGVTDAQAAESLRGLPGDERVVVEGRRGRVEREALGLEVEHGLPVARERRLHEAAGRDGERELVHAGRDRERLRGRVRGREGDLAGRRSENDRPHLVLELLTRKSPLARAYHMIVKEGTYELEVGGCTEAVSGGNRVLRVRARPHHNLVLLDSRGLTGLERGREEVHEAQPCLMVKAVDPRL